MTNTHPEREFREMAVKKALASKNRAAVARELNIPYSRLREWIESYKRRQQKLDTLQMNTQLKAELDESNRRLKSAEEEIEILKKAAAYFAKHQS